MYAVFCHLSQEEAQKQASGLVKDPSRVNNVTVCNLKDENGNVLAKGHSFCVDKDNFNKTTGRKLSLKNALSKVSVDKRVRRELFVKALPSFHKN